MTLDLACHKQTPPSTDGSLASLAPSLVPCLPPRLSRPCNTSAHSLMPRLLRCLSSRLSCPISCPISLSRPVSDHAPSSRAPSLSLLSPISRSLALSFTPRPSHSFPVSLTLSLVPVFCMCPDRWSSVKSAGAPPTDIAGLYSALLKADIVAATGTPVGAGATVTSEDTAAAPSMLSENLSWDVPSCYWSPKNTHRRIGSTKAVWM